MVALSQILLPSPELTWPVEPGVVILFVLTISGFLAVLAVATVRLHSRFARTWDSVDKRLSEVLWRTRHSDPEELRKRTAVLEQSLVDMLDYLRTVANAVDSQLEMLRNEVKTSLTRIDRADSKTLGQSRMIIYQLERIRSQLKGGTEPAPELDSAVLEQRAAEPSASATMQRPPHKVVDTARDSLKSTRQRAAEFDSLLKELSWNH